MSYDRKTGWTKLSSRQLGNYLRREDVQPRTAARLELFFEENGIEYYWDVYGSIHLHCGPGAAWELLSGQPSAWTDPVDAPTEREWISVTDLGAVTEPAAATSTVLKWLREEGLLERHNGKDHPTAAAEGLYMERPAEAAGGRELAAGTMQRLWSYEVVLRLRDRLARAAAVAEADASDPPAATQPTTITVRFPAACSSCGDQIACGDQAEWNRQGGSLRCAACVTASASE